MTRINAMAVDIGGTKIALCAINPEGEITANPETYPIPFDENKVARIDEIQHIIASKAVELVNEGILVSGIGVSICGSVDPIDDRVLLVPNLGWSNVSLCRFLKDQTGLPVFIDQDTRTAALGEASWGIAKGTDNFFWVTIGTGVGSAVFIDGKLYYGMHGFSGWLGHCTIDEVNGIICSCGRRGCLETYVAGPGIARQANETIEEGRGAGLLEFAGGNALSANVVFQAAAAGEPVAEEIIGSSINLLAKSLGMVINILDLKLIILGGGVVKYSPEIIGLVRDAIPPFIVGREVLQDLRIVAESLPNSALYGAGAMVFNRLLEKSM